MSWQVCDVAQPKNLTPRQWQWLCHRGSLTHYLKDQFSNKISFKLLSEGHGYPSAEESDVLAIDTGHQQWIREIGWYFQDKCWILARVVVPLGGHPHFNDIIGSGERSIGDRLFSDNGFTPGAIEVAQLGERHASYQFAHRVVPLSDSWLWARRRPFAKASHHLLVTELFLPDFFADIAHVGA